MLEPTNVLDRLPISRAGGPRRGCCGRSCTRTRGPGPRRLGRLRGPLRGHLSQGGRDLAGDWDRMTAFFGFPAGTRTGGTCARRTWSSEPVRGGAAAHLAAKRFKKVDGATALIWKLLMVAEKRFRKLNAPHLLPGGSRASGTRTASRSRPGSRAWPDGRPGPVPSPGWPKCAAGRRESASREANEAAKRPRRCPNCPAWAPGGNRTRPKSPNPARNRPVPGDPELKTPSNPLAEAA